VAVLLVDDDFLVLVNAWWEPVRPRSLLVLRSKAAGAATSVRQNRA
jgi:hypothetical protein